MKKTKIICSIGPASCSPDVMEKMVYAGMNVARINFSHATLEEKEEVVSAVKEVRQRTGENIAILYDTKGPEFRNGMLENGEINLVKDPEGTPYTETFTVEGNVDEAVSNIKEVIDGYNSLITKMYTFINRIVKRMEKPLLVFTKSLANTILF